MKFIYTFFCDHGGDKARVFVRISLYLKNLNLFIYSTYKEYSKTSKYK